MLTLQRLFLELVFGVALVLAARTLQRRLSAKQPSFSVSSLPGPKPSSRVWGCEWDLYASPPGQKYLEWASKFGHAYRFNGAFGREMLMLSDPIGVNHVLRPAANAFPKPVGVRKFFAALLGKGILYSEGSAHTQQRKVLAPAFNMHAVRDLLPIFFTSARKAISMILEESNGKSSFEVDICHYANLISLDSVSISSFSYDLGLLNKGSQHPLVESLQAMTSSTVNHGYTSFLIRALVWTFPSILKMPTERGQRIKETRRLLGDITTEVLTGSSQDSGDLQLRISALNLLARSENLRQRSQCLSQDQISSQIMSILFAGYETTSTVISWAIYYLCRRPDIQNRLRDELLQVDNPKFEDLQSTDTLPILNAVLKETIRLQPPVLQLHRVAQDDCVIPLSSDFGNRELFVPKGTIIVIPINVMHQNSRVWESPNEWNPDRWIDEDGPAFRKHHQQNSRYATELLAFGDGPRVCIGRNFALVEIKAVLYSLVKELRFSPVMNGSKELELDSFVSFVVRPRVKDELVSRLPVLVQRIQPHE